MKGILIILLCTCSLAVCQDKSVALKGFVNEEFIQLRWAPTTSQNFILGLKNGYQVQRTAGETTEDLIVLPFESRKEDLMKGADQKLLDIIEFTESMLNTNDETGLKQGFGVLTLAASTDKKIAKILGLYIEDTPPNQGSFTYQVSIKGSNLKSNPIKLNTKKKSKNPECSELEGSSRIDLKEVYLNWEAKSLNASYGGYWILKSQDSKNFNILNENPLFHFTSQYEPDKTVINFVDTAVAEGLTYYYKIQPINHFGDLGSESNVKKVYVQKRLEGQCFIDTVEANELTRVIAGHYLGGKNETVAEFVLMRSDKIDSTYTVMDSKEGRDSNFKFTIQTNLRSGDRHYFKVGAISEDGDTAFSYPYYYFSLDQEPPGIPEYLEGIIDSLGIVRLTWTPPTDNDIQGYRVFRMNSLDEEPVEITTEFQYQPEFFDTLQLDNLTSEIFYTVRAVDHNFNNGQNSMALRLIKPDTIAPVPGAFKYYKVKPEGIYLEWSNSNSSDLRQQFVIRQYQFNQDTILSFVDELDTLLDSKGKLGIQYNYYLVAEDESGNSSYSEPLSITYEIGYRPAPVILEAVVMRDEHKIVLRWEKILQPIYSIQIYRAKNEGKFRLYKTIRANSNQFEDEDLSINNEYKYKIKISFAGGISSKLSESISVMY